MVVSIRPPIDSLTVRGRRRLLCEAGGLG
ncbi:protein of unknown function [Streptomyces murinus]